MYVLLSLYVLLLDDIVFMVVAVLFMWLSYVYCHLISMCGRAVLTILMFYLDAGLLARSQYPEGPATGHLGTGFSWFPCV
jgi:hypothetical protein